MSPLSSHLVLHLGQELLDGGEAGHQAPVGALEALVLEEEPHCQDFPVKSLDLAVSFINATISASEPVEMEIIRN